MATKRLFEAIAKSFHEVRERKVDYARDPEVAYEVWAQLLKAIANNLARENPNFDYGRFEEACKKKK